MSEPPKKRLRIGNTKYVPKPVDQSQSRLLQLSDDVLLEILKILSSHQLLVLSETCKRLETLCLDTRSLWVDVDFTGHPMDIKSMKRVLKMLHNRTQSLTLEGFLGQRKSNISESLLSELVETCPNLKRLKLYKFYMQADKIQLKLLPKTLTHFSLAGSELCNLPSDKENGYFKDIHHHLPNLEVLDLQ